MNLLSSHNGLRLVGDCEQDRADGDGQQSDKNDGRQRGNSLCRVGIRIEPILEGRQETSNRRERGQGAEEGDRKDLEPQLIVAILV